MQSETTQLTGQVCVLKYSRRDDPDSKSKVLAVYHTDKQTVLIPGRVLMSEEQLENESCIMLEEISDEPFLPLTVEYFFIQQRHETSDPVQYIYTKTRMLELLEELENKKLDFGGARMDVPDGYSRITAKNYLKSYFYSADDDKVLIPAKLFMADGRYDAFSELIRINERTQEHEAVPDNLASIDGFIFLETSGDDFLNPDFDLPSERVQCFHKLRDNFLANCRQRRKRRNGSLTPVG